MSKFAKKESFDAKEVVANDKKLKIMTESSKAEKKEIAKRIASKKDKAAPKAKAEAKVKEADSRKIKLLTKENPKREGSKSFKRFALYSKCKTVAEFIEAGGTIGDVRYDAQKGYISVA